MSILVRGFPNESHEPASHCHVPGSIDGANLQLEFAGRHPNENGFSLSPLFQLVEFMHEVIERPSFDPGRTRSGEAVGFDLD